jgi:WD40 repeat protein
MGPPTGIIWLPESKFAVAAQYSVGIFEVPLTGPTAQISPPMQAQSQTTNPLFLAASENGNSIAWVSSEKDVQFWSLSSGSAEQIATANAAVTSLTLNSQGDRLAFATFDAQVSQIQDPANPVIENWNAPEWLSNLSFSPDGSHLAGVDLANFVIYVFSLDGKIEKTLEWTGSASANLYGAYISPDWKEVAWVAREAVQIMDMTTGGEGAILNHKDPVSAIAWTLNSEFLATASLSMNGDEIEPVIYIWDPSKDIPIKTLPQMAPIQSLTFSPDGQDLAVLDTKGEVRVFDINP